MTQIKHKEHPLHHNGQTQSGRLPAALDPGFFQMDERSVEDLLGFARAYAAELSFVNQQNVVTGDWTGFLEQTKGKTIAELEQIPSKEPHFALFLCFLNLFGYAQQQLNTLTQRHLNYYYEKVLRLNRRAPQGDKVHLVFQLAKNAHDHLIKKGTQLLAGKDDTGKMLHYEVVEDSIVNQAEVTSLQSVLFRQGAIRAASVANSVDGLGEAPEEQPFAWPAFGDDTRPLSPIGFAVAGPILRLAGGTRKITLQLAVQPGLSPALAAEIAKCARVFVSGEEDWMGPFEASGTWADNAWNLEVETLDPEVKPVVPYAAAVHGGNFNTKEPLLRVVFDAETAIPYMDLLGGLQVTSIDVEVEVTDFKDLELSSTQGPLDAKRAFHPFGAVSPDSGAEFYVDSDEVFAKPLKQLKLHLEWSGMPAQKDGKFSANVLVRSGNLRGESTTVNLLQQGGNLSQTITLPPVFRPLVLLHQAYYFAQPALFYQNRPTQIASIRAGHFALVPTITSAVKNIQIRALDRFITLLRPREGLRFRLSISDRTDNTLPFYAPQMRQLRLDYVAATGKESLGETTLREFDRRSIQFFHLAPLGQAERHAFLQKQATEVAPQISLLPVPQVAGQLMIGLRGIEARQSLQLLIQVLEGSANPLRSPEKVEWSMLVRNNWQVLDEKYLLYDRTNGLLTSGILRIGIPPQATADNTLLPGGLLWLRATVKNHADSVCRLLDVKAQGIETVWIDQENSATHLLQPLEAGKISKLMIQDAKVKKIEQPYPSFGGRGPESDTAYFTRVAERLRHKQRGVSVWDYERLILEQFPRIFQVKCVPHCSPESEFAPGHLTLVVLPDYRNYHAGDPLRPMVSLHTIAQVQSFISGYAPPDLQIHVQNPEYEQIELGMKAFFHSPDAGFYTKQLNSDLIRLLSPWANAGDKGVDFEGRYYRSALIYAVEQLEYVDYISHVEMRRISVGGTASLPLDELTATQSRAIVVPVSSHKISTE